MDINLCPADKLLHYQMDIILCPPDKFLLFQMDINLGHPDKLSLVQMDTNICPAGLLVDQTDINLWLPTVLLVD